MKIIFNDKSYLEITSKNDKIVIVLSAKDGNNPYNTIINSAEITKEQFDNIIKEINEG